MELVIKIPDILMEYIIKGKDLSEKQNNEMALAIANGTPLPKGHGRIIDESKIEVCEWVDVLEEGYPKASTDAPTIIEADGGGKDDES